MRWKVWALAGLAAVLMAPSEYNASQVVFDDDATLQAKLDAGELGGGSSCADLSALSDVTGPVLGTSNRIRFSTASPAVSGNAVCFDVNGNLEDCGVDPTVEASFTVGTLTDPSSITTANVDAYDYISIVYTGTPPDLTPDIEAPTNDKVVTIVNNSATPTAIAYNARRAAFETFPDLFPGDALSIAWDGTNWVRVTQTNYPIPKRTFGCTGAQAGAGSSCKYSDSGSLLMNATEDRWYQTRFVNGAGERSIYRDAYAPINLVQKEGNAGNWLTVFCDDANDVLTHSYLVDIEHWTQFDTTAAPPTFDLRMYTATFLESAEADYTDSRLNITPTYEGLGFGDAVLSGAADTETYSRTSTGLSTVPQFQVEIADGECLAVLGYTAAGGTIDVNSEHFTVGFTEISAQ